MQIILLRDFRCEIADALANLGLWFFRVVAWLAEDAPSPRAARLRLQRHLLYTCRLYTRREIRVMLA